MEIQFADTEEKILKCRDAILELRPHIKEEEFLQKIKLLQSEGTRMVFIKEKSKAVCAMVFRINHYLYRGKNIYVDDLVTLPETRSNGFGGKMIDWLIDFAKKNKVENIHLDSGHHRYDAHRFYLNKGFRIASHHFVLDLK